jgi:ankyrin repeat protein
MSISAFFRHLAFISLIALGWSISAYCGEIHDAAIKGDLTKVKALLKDNPNLVASESNNGFKPLHYAVSSGHKDVAELLLRHGAHE